MKHRILHYLIPGLVACGIFGLSTMALGGKWEEKATLPKMGAISGGAWWLGAEAVNGQIYVFGGQDDLQPAGKLVHVYDPDRDKWIRLKKWPRGRFRLGSALVRGKIYAVGGTEDNFQAVPFLDQYDPKTDTWTPKADMPTARMMTATAVVGGKIYVIGGAESFYFPSAAVEVYDPVTDTWEKKADMPNPRWGAGVFAARGKIYVCGGAVDQSHQKYTDLTEEYDPKTDTWTEKADMPVAYYDMAVSFVNSGKAYAIGGRTFDGNDRDGRLIDGWTYHWTVFEYDLEKNRWARLKDQMPTPRASLASTVLDGKIYAIAGHNGIPGITEVYTADGWPFPAGFSVDPQDKLAAIWGKIKRSQ